MIRALGQAGLILFASLMVAPVAEAQDRSNLGQARLFTNDFLGDGRDRWRSGSYGVSTVRGPSWNGVLPMQIGEIMEYRFRGEVITPASVNNPDPADRLYAGVLSVGAHSHFGWRGLEVSAGADLVAIGEQTGISGLQEAVHDVFSLQSLNVDNFQVENGFFLHGTLEVAQEFYVNGARVRPFVELQAGVETMARAGVDFTFGGYGEGGLRLRDHTTGHRISAIDSEEDSGYSLLLGGDIAYVDSSQYLPSDQGYEVEETRYRLRGGVNYAFGHSNIFYGLTYLSEEFVGQTEGQTIGSLTVNIEF